MYQVIRFGNGKPSEVVLERKTRLAAEAQAEALANDWPEYTWKVYDTAKRLYIWNSRVG